MIDATGEIFGDVPNIAARAQALAEPGAVVVTARGEQGEGWLTRLKRMLFGWRAASTRADLELVLTAEQAQSDFSPEEAASR